VVAPAADDAAVDDLAADDAAAGVDAGAEDTAGEAAGSGAIEDRSTVDPTDRIVEVVGEAEVMVTSFCGSTLGDGVELVVVGAEPGTVLEGSVNSQTLQAQAFDDGVAYQVLVITDTSFTVAPELPGADEPFEAELEGCG
jgi:hypothetical protein